MMSSQHHNEIVNDTIVGNHKSSHKREYSTSESVLTYSEDDSDESIRWNERFAGSKDDGEWANLLQSVGDMHPLHPESEKMNQNLLDGNQVIQHHDNLLESGEYKVYRERWLMLLYMSVLNILSDWTCYSIAPISLLISEEYPIIDPQSLVTIFLISSSISTLLEPMILARVGLRRTVVLGAFLLLLGNAIKSGFKQIFDPHAQVELSPGRTYTGFFLVGLSQPLYQCTPALLSASWFPDDERTLATGLALNSNQLGIGFAFTFGTILVDSKRAVVPYFALLSILSSVAFVGCLLQFKDAPPSPPSKTARVMKGNFVFKFTNNTNLRDYISKKLSNARDSLKNELNQCYGGLGYQDSTGVNGHLNPSTHFVSQGFYRRNYKDKIDLNDGDLCKSFNTRERNGYVSVLNPTNDIKSPNVNLQRHRKNASKSKVLYYIENPDLEYPWNMENSQSRFDDGVEPIIIQSDRYLEIDILDDQLLRSIRACFSRAGFIHSLVAFTVSSVVVNVLSTYMDYLMRIGGADSLHVGVIGGLFQLVIVLSGMLVGKVTDETRSYYSTTIALLVLGAFALAECGIDLDRGTDLQWSLLLTAIFVGPLQPIATELGVDVCFPLCENTVLVIQQLFASLISALFIPLFQAVRSVGQQVEGADDRPQYMFSLYLLIVIHAVGTVYFSTFDGRYLRLEHEKESQGT